MDLQDMTGLEVSFVCPTCLKEIKNFLLNGYSLKFSGCSACTGVTSCCITCPECENDIELLTY
ncbi:MAG: hypothetical protein MRK02_08150 [Candidatus Scalindua sp.]|nr:hypothetical protein [Candidatus Scalindua sp.]